MIIETVVAVVGLVVAIAIAALLLQLSCRLANWCINRASMDEISVSVPTLRAAAAILIMSALAMGLVQDLIMGAGGGFVMQFGSRLVAVIGMTLFVASFLRTREVHFRHATLAALIYAAMFHLVVTVVARIPNLLA